jgi:hypothetical protein
MLINEVNINITEISVSNIFKNFDLSNFKNQPPPSDNSDETKKEMMINTRNEIQQDVLNNIFTFYQT